jgi:hypothetical protein
MFILITVIALMAGAAAWQGVRLARQKQWKAMAVVSALWVFATTYSALVISEITLINPNKIIVALLDLLYSRFN